jgi:transcriptional activator HAC1
VERVLRNRRAAQSSRERKRQEVEALEAEKRAIERRNQDLEMRLADMQAKNELLMRELEAFTGGMTVFRSSSVASTPGQSEQLRSAPTPVTFSQELFGSRDAQEQPISTQPIIKSEPTQTVNPASLSPEIRPVDESANASSSDMTQHPAVSVGRTTALDGYQNSNDFSHLSNLGNHSLHQYDFGGYFDAPDPTESDRQFFENGIAPIADQFDLNYDHLVSHNDSVIDDFNLDDFLHHDDQPAPEIHSSDSLAETTANLQPQLGASSFGCDDGGHAVSV